jgi:hypothetical protein
LIDLRVYLNYNKTLKVHEKLERKKNTCGSVGRGCEIFKRRRKEGGQVR